jgi:alkylation response protein AidB-like acyl-CoA dehydrogenase
MDFTLTDRQKEAVSIAQAFAAAEIAPHLQQLEEDVDFRMHLYQKMARQGLFTLALGSDFLAYCLSLKAIAKVDAGLSVAMTVTNMVAEAIQRFGTQEQKENYLTGISNGDIVPAAFALTEKEIGSDAKHIEMQASRQQQDYVLHGEKHLISNGDLAGVLLVLAKTGEDSISAFLVDRGTPGLSVIGKEQKLGLSTAHLVRLKFDHCRIGGSCLLGKEGEGLKIALNSLDAGRLGIAAQALGISEAAFEAALDYARKRHQFGEPLTHFQAVSFKLADMRLKITVSEALLYKACWMHDQKMDVRSIVAQVKLHNSEAANEIATDALQIFGGYGYIKANPVEKYFRDARATTIYEGTSEIQRLIIARFL